MHHAFRHSGASRLDKAGTPLTVIQKILGREKATTTDIYLRSLRGSAKKAMRSLDDLK
jgi:site-specific recombinase XerD